MPANPAIRSWVTGSSAVLGRLIPFALLAFSRGAAMVSQLLVQVAVGALSGPVGLGVLQLFTAWSNLLGEVLARGWPPTVLKRVSSAGIRSESGAGEYQHALRTVFRSGLPLVGLVIACLILAGLFSVSGGDHSTQLAIAGVAVGALAFALTRIGAEALKAANAPLVAVTLENLAFPVTLLGICLYFWLTGSLMTPLALILAGVAAFVGGAMLMHRAAGLHLGEDSNPLPVEEDDRQRKERHALWFGGILAIAFLQWPFLVLPLFADTATIGIFAVAYKLVNVITTLLILLNAVYGPAFARAAARGDRQRLGQLLLRTQWLSVTLYGSAALLLLMLSGELSALFNVPAADLHRFIILLALGQAFNAVTGLSGVLLSLTGAARAEWRISLLAFIVALLTALPLGQHFGAAGIAAGFSAVIAIKNIASWAMARRHLRTGALRP